MASGSTSICGLCDLRHITKPSVIWCPECDEGLCIDCKEHHSLSKASRKHSTIPISDYQTLPSHVLEIKEFCSEHQERFEIFCKKHDCPCCRKCVLSEHNKCEDMVAIETVTENVKTSDLYLETEQLIIEILENIGQIRKDREKNSSSLADQRKMVEDEITKAREKLNEHLDTLQDCLLKELSEAEIKVTVETSAILTTLDENEKQLIGYQTDMSAIKQYASDLQTFLAMKQIERNVASHDTSILSLPTNQGMRNTIIKCDFDTLIQNCSVNILRFGQIDVQGQPSELKIVRKKNKQAQIMAIMTPTITAENVSLKLHQTVQTGGKDVTGCALLSDGRMVFSCNATYSVRSFNKDGSQDFDTGELWPPTFDICFIEDTNTVAVTSGYSGDHLINFIDIHTGTEIKTTSVKSFCYGLVYRNNTLIYRASDDGIRMLNLFDNSESALITRKLSPGGYIALFKDNLYYTDRGANTVTCCDLTGNTQWEFKNETILKYPCGITVDNDGNVYVVGGDTCNVVVISPDRQRYRQLLSKSDGLYKPRVLHFERSTNQLLVANKEDTAFLFTIDQ